MTSMFKASCAAGLCAAVFAVAAAAKAEPVQVSKDGEIRIQVTDLDLTTRLGRAEFEHRAGRAARVACWDVSDNLTLGVCEQSVIDEAHEDLRLKQEEIARASRNYNFASAESR